MKMLRMFRSIVFGVVLAAILCVMGQSRAYAWATEPAYFSGYKIHRVYTCDNIWYWDLLISLSYQYVPHDAVQWGSARVTNSSLFIVPQGAGGWAPQPGYNRAEITCTPGVVGPVSSPPFQQGGFVMYQHEYDQHWYYLYFDEGKWDLRNDYGVAQTCYITTYKPIGGGAVQPIVASFQIPTDGVNISGDGHTLDIDLSHIPSAPSVGLCPQANLLVGL